MSSNWFVDYHHALQLRLLGMAIFLAVVWPSCWLLLGFVRCAGRVIAWHLPVARRRGEPAPNLTP